MSPLWKFLLPLVVALPLGGFVVGSLVTVANDEPPPRPPIELRDETTDGDDRGKRDGSGEDDGDDGDRRGSPVPGITPRPGEVDDDGAGDGDDDERADDTDTDTDDDGGGEDGDDGGDDGDD